MTDDDLNSIEESTIDLLYDHADGLALKVLAAAQPGVPVPESALVKYRAAIENAEEFAHSAGKDMADRARYARGELTDTDGNPNIFF